MRNRLLVSFVFVFIAAALIGYWLGKNSAKKSSDSAFVGDEFGGGQMHNI